MAEERSRGRRHPIRAAGMKEVRLGNAEDASHMSLAGEVASAVEIGHEYGWDDMDILKCILRNIGGERRREMVVLWGDAVGLEPRSALRKAHEAGEIPTPSPPRSLKKGTLQRIARAGTSE